MMINNCELCNSSEALNEYRVEPTIKKGADASVSLCAHCLSQVKSSNFSDKHHWQCLHESIWSERAPVKVLAYKILYSLKNEPWALDLMDQIMLEDEDLKWAQSGLESETSSNVAKPTLDSNGAVLLEGDSVTLIKDLEVKGAGFTAKRGTLVKNIRLTDNHEQIDAKVNGIQIVLLTKFLKKI